MYTPSFHLAQDSDIPLVLEMMAEFYAIDGYPFDLELNRKNLGIFIRNPELGRLWLINAGAGETAGYACLAFGFSFEYRGRDAFLDELYLREKYRRQGIGQQAMDFIESQARELGVQAIHLEVEHHNAVGNRIYDKRGYKGKHRHMLTKPLQDHSGASDASSFIK